MSPATFRVQTSMVTGHPPPKATRVEESGTCGAIISVLPDGTIRVIVLVPGDE